MPLSSESIIVKPTGGLTKNDIDSYSFNIYSTNKVYEKQNSKIKDTYTNTKRIYVDSLGSIVAGSMVSFTNKSLEALNNPNDTTGEDEATYKVVGTGVDSLRLEKISIDTAITVKKGVEIFQVDDQGKLLQITVVIFNKKSTLVEESSYMDFADYMSVSKNSSVFVVVHSEFEERDNLLITSLTPGVWGNKISIAITPSRDYANAYKIVVYYDGIHVETWEVTNESFLDGFGKQMYVEDRINGYSSYINVVHNTADVDDNNVPKTPLYTSYSLWRKNPVRVFVATTNQTVENILDFN